jgi:hypothetical protein
MTAGKSRAPFRIFQIPDTQVKPGVPLDHLDWIAKAIIEYRPDVVIHSGDHWDFPSLNGHAKPGSAPMEGKRYLSDVEAGNEALERIDAPIRKQRKSWTPRKIFLLGNHEDRADRAANDDPKFFGHVGSVDCDTLGWERHAFLERVWVEGICFSHYFQGSHSWRPIGGEVSNRLSKIGCSFVQGHEQGFRYGNRIMASGKTVHGLVAGSCYLHVEDYRGAQGQTHWRGVVVLNGVEDGDYCVMPLTLNYLCQKYTGMGLREYMVRTYPHGDWRHLGPAKHIRKAA